MFGINTHKKRHNFLSCSFLCSQFCRKVVQLRTEYILNGIIHCFGESVRQMHCPQRQRTNQCTNVWDAKKNWEQFRTFFDIRSEFYLWYHLSQSPHRKWLHTRIKWIIPKHNHIRQMLKLCILLDACTGSNWYTAMLSEIVCRKLWNAILLSVSKLLPFRIAWNGTKRIFIDLVYYSIGNKIAWRFRSCSAASFYWHPKLDGRSGFT